MECKESRKQLRAYAAGEIKEGPARKELENHIAGCAVCKRELLMWQDVLAAQQTMMNENYGSGFSLKDKVDRVNADMGADAHLPPAIRRLRSITRSLKAGKGRLVWQILFVMFAPMFIFLFLKRDMNPAVIVLITVACLSLLYVVIKTRGIK